MDKEKASYEIFNKIRDEKSRFFDKEENSDKYFDLIKEYMLSEANYDLSLYRDNYLKGRLYHRVRSKKYGNFQAYYITLQQNPREVLALKNILTIHTTEFFRNKSVFRYLEKVLIPKISASKPTRNKPIRILSAPCSSGEEVYSIAIIIHFLKMTKQIYNPVEIYGVDIDEKSIQKAKKGTYRLDHIKNISGQALKRNFDLVGNNYLRIKKEIANYCKFQVHDMFKAFNFNQKFDLIACRNFLIYISKKDQTRIIENLKNHAHKNTYFMLGMTEGIKLMNRTDFEVEDLKSHIYQYIGGSVGHHRRPQKTHVHQRKKRIKAKPRNIKIKSKKVLPERTSVQKQDKIKYEKHLSETQGTFEKLGRHAQDKDEITRKIEKEEKEEKEIIQKESVEYSQEHISEDPDVIEWEESIDDPLIDEPEGFVENEIDTEFFEKEPEGLHQPELKEQKEKTIYTINNISQEEIFDILNTMEEEEYEEIEKIIERARNLEVKRETQTPEENSDSEQQIKHIGLDYEMMLERHIKNRVQEASKSISDEKLKEQFLEMNPNIEGEQPKQTKLKTTKDKNTKDENTRDKATTKKTISSKKLKIKKEKRRKSRKRRGKGRKSRRKRRFSWFRKEDINKAVEREAKSIPENQINEEFKRMNPDLFSDNGSREQRKEKEEKTDKENKDQSITETQQDDKKPKSQKKAIKRALDVVEDLSSEKEDEIAAIVRRAKMKNEQAAEE